MSTPVGPMPATIPCPLCHQPTTTRVEPRATTRTHLVALLMCALCCWPCAACLYCTDCARSIDHFCPLCNNYIGTYER